MKKNRHISSLIHRLAAVEADFVRTRFLAPVAGGGSVQVRIGKVVCRMGVRPENFTGWGVFQPTSYNDAAFVRDAKLSERRKYLDLFPAARLIITEHASPAWLAVPAKVNDRRFGIEGQAPVHAVEDAEAFDTVLARFDGTQFWYDELDPQADPAIALYLRESIVQLLDPRFVSRDGISPEQRQAYAAVHARRLAEKLASEQAMGEYRVRNALEHAGAKLRGFAEVGGSYRVTYSVGGHRHMSVVDKKTLSVQSAGICLSGQDAIFDLASLVSVLREGHSAGGIHHGLHV